MNKDKRIRFFKDFIMPLKGEFIVCSILMLITLLLQLYFPMGVKRAIDNGIMKNDIKRLIIEILILLSVGCIEAFFDYKKYYKITKSISVLEFNVQYKILNKLQSCSMKFFSNSKPGENSSIIERDVEQVTDLIYTALSNIIMQLCSYIVILSVLFAMNWKIAIYALTISPLLALFQLKMGKRIKKIYKNIRENIADINDFTQEWLENVIDIQLFSYGNSIKNKYEKKNWNYIDSEVKATKVQSITSVVGQIINTIGIIMILYWVGTDVIDGKSSVGDITALTIYIQRVYSPLSQIMNGIIQVQNSSVVLDRIYSLIDCKDVVSDGTDEINNHLEGNIKIKDLTFNYGERDIFKNLSLEIKSGELVGIIGKNGAGKSTIAKLLTRLYDFNEGSIYIDGMDISKYKIDDLRREIVYVQAKPYIINGTIKENILLDQYKDFSLERLEQIINEVGLTKDINNMEKGLDTILYSHSTNLSTGQCQKISLARVLAKNPSIVILDEPTSALDLEIEKEVTKTIQKAFEGKTIIIISHRDEVLKICNKVYRMEDFNTKEDYKMFNEV